MTKQKKIHSIIENIKHTIIYELSGRDDEDGILMTARDLTEQLIGYVSNYVLEFNENPLHFEQ